MEDLISVQVLKEKIKESINLSSLIDSEKDLIEILVNILDLIYDFILNNKKEVNKCLDIKTKIIKFTEKKYTKTEFHILEVDSFDDSSNYISTLINNFLFYFTDYKMDDNLINIYYYLFHLIYYILLLVVNTKNKNIFGEKDIKFYINQIIHFFQGDKKTPEYNYFFYEGVFIYLSRKYNIKFKFLFPLDKNLIYEFFSTYKIAKMNNNFYRKILNKKNWTENENIFLGEYSNIKKEILLIAIDNNYEAEDLLKVCNDTLNKIKKIEIIYEKYKLKCEEMSEYENNMNELIKIISKYELTDNHFSLMFYNFNQMTKNIETFLFCAKKWIKLNYELNQDYSEIFSKIITSVDFKELI